MNNLEVLAWWLFSLKVWKHSGSFRRTRYHHFSTVVIYLNLPEPEAFTWNRLTLLEEKALFNLFLFYIGLYSIQYILYSNICFWSACLLICCCFLSVSIVYITGHFLIISWFIFIWTLIVFRLYNVFLNELILPLEAGCLPAVIHARTQWFRTQQIYSASEF